jgi:hypothetical protein
MRKMTMNPTKETDLVRETRRKYKLQQEHLAASERAGAATSPRVVEGTLADISAEVTAEAIERRARELKPR